MTPRPPSLPRPYPVPDGVCLNPVPPSPPSIGTGYGVHTGANEEEQTPSPSLHVTTETRS